ncbi:MAG: ParB/RepB/Spo0J family partition protein [Patescibacteria group bacterium]
MQKTQGGLGRGLGALLPPAGSSMNTVERNERSLRLSEMSEENSPQHQVVAQLAQGGNPPIAQGASRSLSGSDDRLLRVSPTDIVANPRQPRHHFAEEDLTDLMASVKEHGILQPLVVSVREDGKYELIAGERRLRSARAVGLESVPVIVRNVTDQQKLELALIENIQRADLNAVEEAKAYKMLIDDFNLTQEDVAGRVGKSRSQVANTLRLLDLPTDMLAAVVEGRITKSHARTLLSEPNDARRRELFERMLGGGVTVRSAESLTSQRRAVSKDSNILALESALREKLGTKVSIDMHGAKSTITIHCYSKEDLAAMIRQLNA